LKRNRLISMSNSNKITKRGNLVIYLFPYLFFDKEQTIDGYSLKPSYKEIVEKESKRVQGHLSRIAKSFSYRSAANIFQYTYGHTTVHNENEWMKLKSTLNTFSTLLRYQELSDERNGADYSNFDYAVFEINRPMFRKDRGFYRGVLNGNTELNINYPEIKFIPNHSLRSHIFYADSENQVFQHLMYFSQLHTRSEAEKKRLIRSFEWFNKSYKNDPEIDDYERFINLVIAFETLFNSPEEGIQSALTTGVTTLLGETEEMIHWIKKFYGVRSAIVHGREEPTIAYKGKDSNEFHLNHIVFARKVFTKCIKAIFSAREKVYTEDLHKELISNERRIHEILIALNKNKTVKKIYEAGVFSNIDSLSQRDPTGKSTDIRKIAKLILPLGRKFLKKNKDKNMLQLLDYLVQDNEADIGNLAVKYSDFHSGFNSYYFGDRTISTDKLPELVLKGAIYNLTAFAGWKLMHSAWNRKND
jgi:hypothetical protein